MQSDQQPLCSRSACLLRCGLHAQKHACYDDGRLTLWQPHIGASIFLQILIGTQRTGSCLCKGLCSRALKATAVAPESTLPPGVAAGVISVVV